MKAFDAAGMFVLYQDAEPMHAYFAILSPTYTLAMFIRVGTLPPLFRVMARYTHFALHCFITTLYCDDAGDIYIMMRCGGHTPFRMTSAYHRQRSTTRYTPFLLPQRRPRISALPAHAVIREDAEAERWYEARLTKRMLFGGTRLILSYIYDRKFGVLPTCGVIALFCLRLIYYVSASLMLIDDIILCWLSWWERFNWALMIIF